MTIKDLQYNIPLFVRSRHRTITWKGKSWKYNDYIPWQELGIPLDIVRTWFAIDLVYHNEELEAQTKVGDRLSEMDSEQLRKLVEAINVQVRKRTNSAAELKAKRCKMSRIDEKQRGLIRSFLRNNKWIEDEYYDIRDSILDQ